MHTISIQVNNLRRYTSSLNLSEKERVIIHIFLYILLAEFFAMLFIIKMWFFSSDVNDVLMYVSRVEASVKTGMETEQFVLELKNSGMNPQVVQQIKRKPLTVKGALVALNKDNIQVFEYQTNDAAMKETLLLAKKYRGPEPNRWEGVVHIYVKDKLVVFYMGKDENILSWLSPNSKVSLIKTKPVEVSRI